MHPQALPIPQDHHSTRLAEDCKEVLGDSMGRPTPAEIQPKGMVPNFVSWAPRAQNLKPYVHKTLPLSSLFCSNKNVGCKYDKQNIHLIKPLTGAFISPGLFYKNRCM